MTIAKITLAATLALSALGMAGTASAKDHHNDRHHNGWNNHRGHQVCKTVWRHHHRERVCRWVR